MNNEEKFKNTLKELLDSKSFPYDAANWEIASAALDAAKNKRRNGFFIWFITLGLGLFTVGYFAIQPVKEDEYTAALEGAHHTLCKYEKATPASAEINEAIEGLEKVSTPLDLTQTPAVTKPSHTETQPELTKTTPAPTQSKPEQTIPKQEPAQPEKDSGSPNVKNSTKVGEKENNENAIPIAIGTTPPVSKVPNGAVKDNLETTGQKVEKEEPITIDNTEEKKNDDKNKNHEPNNNGVSNINPIVEPKKEEKSTSPVEPEKKQNVVEPIVNIITPSITTASLEKQKAEPKKADSVITAAFTPTLTSKSLVNFCYAEAGASFNSGWKYNSTRDGSGINPILGITYLNMLNEKFGVSIGGYYTSVSNLKYSSKTALISKLDLGVESEVTKITPTTINYLQIPIGADYFLDSKNAISINYQINYLLDVQSKVEKYTDINSKIENYSSYKTGGYVEGFKTFNSQISVAYRRKLYEDLWLKTGLFFGIDDIKNNAFFGENVTERISGIKLSLTYNIIKK